MYVKSFDYSQLSGAGVTGSTTPVIDTLCGPLRDAAGAANVSVGGVPYLVSTTAVYYPCGLIANSLFTGF